MLHRPTDFRERAVYFRATAESEAVLISNPNALRALHCPPPPSPSRPSFRPAPLVTHIKTRRTALKRPCPVVGPLFIHARYTRAC